jgi:deferrochelatase/peroxidase EfeB
VYRRLVQDVEAFRAAMDRYAALRTRRGKLEPERAAERVIGRRKDGSALALSARELATTGDKEAFDYSSGACPVAAHVRKCNPRLSRRQLRELYNLDSFPVIYRRGVAFGPRVAMTPPELVQQRPLASSVERGLHFLCYQRSIERQYEFIIRQCVNSPDFPEPGSGVDALIGALPRTDPNAPRPVNLDGAPRPLDPFATPSGGGYFFAPSLPAVRELGRRAGGDGSSERGQAAPEPPYPRPSLRSAQ